MHPLGANPFAFFSRQHCLQPMSDNLIDGLRTCAIRRRERLGGMLNYYYRDAA
jgi:hypothetical protein